jgi:hypothetical protein
VRANEKERERETDRQTDRQTWGRKKRRIREKFGGWTVNKRTTQILSFKPEDLEKQKKNEKKRKQNWGKAREKTNKEPVVPSVLFSMTGPR